MALPRWLQIARSVTLLKLRGGYMGYAMVASLLWITASCLYLDTPNARPSIGIVRMSDTSVERGGTMALYAATHDDDGTQAQIALQWAAFACDGAGCDAQAFFTSTQASITLTVPSARGSGAAVERVRVVLDGADARGAAARPQATLQLDVKNATPTIAAQIAGFQTATLNVPVRVVATLGDVDDAVATLRPTIRIVPPQQAAPALVTAPGHDPARGALAWTFTPNEVGLWTIYVEAVDPLGATARVTLPLLVERDKPPCLTMVTPAPALAPHATLLQDPVRVAVVAVADDVDAWPSSAVAESQLQFQWSQRIDGGAWGGVGTGPAVALAPGDFPLGSVVELRVEIADRVPRPLACAEDARTCSANFDGCLQRVTWVWEVR